MGVISLVQFRFGIFSPMNNPNSAISSTFSRQHTAASSASNGEKPIMGRAQHSRNTIGMPVSSSCSFSLAFSASQTGTGRERSTHRFLPSREMEGAAMSFMLASRQAMETVSASR